MHHGAVAGRLGQFELRQFQRAAFEHEALHRGLTAHHYQNSKARTPSHVAADEYKSFVAALGKDLRQVDGGDFGEPIGFEKLFGGVPERAASLGIQQLHQGLRAMSRFGGGCCALRLQ